MSRWMKGLHILAGLMLVAMVSIQHIPAFDWIRQLLAIPLPLHYGGESIPIPMWLEIALDTVLLTMAYVVIRIVEWHPASASRIRIPKGRLVGVTIATPSELELLKIVASPDSPHTTSAVNHLPKWTLRDKDGNLLKLFLLALFIPAAAQAQTPVTVISTFHGHELRHGKGELWIVIAQRTMAVHVAYDVMRGADGAIVQQDAIPGALPATGVYGFSPKGNFAWLGLDYNGKGLHTFEDFQASTQVRTALLEGVEMIQGRGNRTYTWKQEAEGWLEGQISIANGSRDIRLVLRTNVGTRECETKPGIMSNTTALYACLSDVVWNSGIVAGRAELRQPLHAGAVYTLTIDNSQAVVMPKQIAGRIIRVDYK